MDFVEAVVAAVGAVVAVVASIRAVIAAVASVRAVTTLVEDEMRPARLTTGSFLSLSTDPWMLKARPFTLWSLSLFLTVNFR
jgi:hypothetical protein